MQFGLTMELALWLFAVVLVLVPLKQLLFRILMAIVTRWAHRTHRS